MLDHAPSARRPRVGRGDHGDQPPPREQPVMWRSRSTPTSPTSSRSRTAPSPSENHCDTTATLTLAYEDGDFPPVGDDRHQLAGHDHARTGSSTSSSSRPVSSGRRRFTITPRRSGRCRVLRRAGRGTRSRGVQAKAAELETWLAGTPVLQAEDPALLRTYRASLSDLGALRMHPDLARGRDAARSRAAVVHGVVRSRQPDHQLPGAPLPARHWPPRPCACLPPARRASATTSTSRSRARSSTSCVLGSSPRAASVPIRRTSGPRTPRRCSSILLDEYHRWSGDDELVRALEPNARAALAWIERQR